MNSLLIVVGSDGNASIPIAAPFGIKSLTINSLDCTKSFYFGTGGILFPIAASTITQFDRDYFTHEVFDFVRVSGGTSGDKIVITYGLWLKGERERVVNGK